jgi:D-glycero-alpha-D-manno-heptose-7-phosphate kinase
MILTKSPFRISFFGGSSDYEDFYKEHGSFLIGTTIDKYVYTCLRYRPKMVDNNHFISYSKIESVKNLSDIENPLVRECLKFHNISKPIELNYFSDLPSRVGLGGSSTFCVCLLHSLKKLDGLSSTKKEIAKSSIFVERVILQEPGGIQDQIWPAYGGLNTIEISKTGDFHVKPLAVTEEFKEKLQNSMVLIYTNHQRKQNDIAKSHENKNKLPILNLAKEAHKLFLNEDIKQIGTLLYQSWQEKKNISNLISSQKVDSIIDMSMSMGAYGAKLLGSGGCGFVLVLCDPRTKAKITEKFEDDVLDFKFDYDGVKTL